MLAVALEPSQVKTFMGQLLREDIFDGFEVRTVDIGTNVHVSIDGLLAAEGEEKPSFSTWGSLRPLVYGIVKASPKPKYVKIVFSYCGAGACELHPNAAALFLNMAYENDGVTFTTGTAQREFLMDRSLDTVWTEWVSGFFAQAKLLVQERA